MPGKESTPPFQSKLTPYRNEILKAWFRRQTLKEIQTMLQKHGVTISLSGISLFIKRHKKKYDPRATPQTKKPRSVKPSKDIEKSLKKLDELLAHNPKESARECARNCSQLNITKKRSSWKNRFCS